MQSRQISSPDIKALHNLLQQSENIIITCHISPDGDALGSSLGLSHLLANAGKKCVVITPDTPPKNLLFLPGAPDITVFSKDEMLAANLLADADLVFSLDYNEPHRIDRLAEPLLAASAPKVMIDHHLFPDNFSDITISQPESSSTSLLIYRVAIQLGLEKHIDAKVATCIYTGMMTDTGNFSYNSNDPFIYTAISKLLETGINKDEIYSRVFNSNTAHRLRLNGYAIDRKMEIFTEYSTAMITLSRQELNHYQYVKGDTESLVNVPLSIPEIICSFFIREEAGYIKISARSKGDFPVNKICEEHFSGGGHKNAAGGELHCSLEEAIEKFTELLPTFSKYK